MVPSSADVEGDVLDAVEQEQLKRVLWSLVDVLMMIINWQCSGRGTRKRKR